MRIFKLIPFFVFLPVFAVEYKIGFIDSNKILQEYKGTQDLQKKYQAKINEWQKKMDKMKKDIEELQKQFQTQQIYLSDEAKGRKLQELQNKQKEYENFIQSIWGQDGEAKKLNDQLMKPFLSKVDSLLKKIGQEEGYSFILDISAGSVVYADEIFDLTDRVISELNKEFGPEITPTEKIYYYCAKFKELTGEAKSGGLGDRVKNILTTYFKNRGRLEEINYTIISQAKNVAGVVKEDEDITQENAMKIVENANLDLFIFGSISKSGEIIEINYKIIKNKGREIKEGKISIKGERFLQENIVNEITKGIPEFLK